VFYKAVSWQDMTNPVTLPSFLLYLGYISLIVDFMQHFFTSQTIGPTDLLSPSPAPQFETYKVLAEVAAPV
jgi:hypothetical protein